MAVDAPTQSSHDLEGPYSVVAELLARGATNRGADHELRGRLASAPAEVARLVDAFLRDGRRADAPCPLHLGSCLHGSNGADGPNLRGAYLQDILDVFWYFGLDPVGPEPPDDLPRMVEFAALSATLTDTVGRAAARRYFLGQVLAPGLEPLASRLEASASRLALLVRALEILVKEDLARSATLPGASGPPTGVRRLPVVEGP